MMPNNWIKPLDKVLPHVEWNSAQKHLRSEWKPVRHSNTAHELHIILQGSCRVELVDREVEIKAGQGLIILPNTFHCCRSITKPFLRMTVNFIPQNQDLLTEPANGDKFFFFQTTQPIERTCHEIFEEVDRRTHYLVNEMLCAMFSKLMIHVLRAIQPGQASHAITFDHSAAHIIDSYFSSFNMQGGHTRKGLSKKLHCSERQLNRILSELYGMTFQEKRLQARMDYAKYLLRNTDMKIPEISSQVGYSNETSFYKVFRATCGITPKDFRNQHVGSADPD
ncbi:MAG: AraC family transcriptional regulator [Oscillospiraceae bacterium]|nr:AraC family transcriptional regulator [Oscillospiraceae bacterium]